ncbi:MAG: carbohydrate ABC transporter permease [Fimbriimonadales bacterium]|nr:carbohydrate ABC transporter permease [Fimbriimonadales bacterium]
MSKSVVNPDALAKDWKKVTARAELTAKILRALLWMVLLIGVVLSLTPFYMMIVMSLKTPGELAGSSAWAWPKGLTWENYQKVLSNPNAPFLLFFRNSVIIAFVSTLGVMISSSLVAYAFARLKFRGRDQLFMLLLSTMMLPGIVTMIPQYVLWKYLGWIDTFYPMTIPAFFGGGAYNIFLLRQFLMGIPRDIDEAALIDGANHATIFWKLLIPNMGPAMATVGIFAFIYNWKDFMGPLVILNSPENQTLELGLATYRALNQNQWELLMAGSVLVMIPIMVLFFLGQRYFVKGIVMTGIK